MVVFKLVIFFVFVRVVMYAFISFLLYARPMLYTIGLASILVGALGAFDTAHMKRFIAFSSVNHAGYVILCLTDTELLPAALLYLCFYLLGNLVLLGIVSGLVTAQDRGVVYISDLRYIRGCDGLNHMPIFLTASAWSLAGLPPSLGFFGKFYIVTTLIQVGALFTAALLLAARAVGGAYSFRIVGEG